MRGYLLIFTLVIGLPILSNAQKNKGKYFYGEDAFKKSVPIPESVVRALRKDKEFLACAERVGFPSERFQATEIDLNHDRLSELLVKGECGNSATSYYFWIFAKNKRYDPLLFVATMGVNISRKTTKGYSNIWAVGCLPSACLNQTFTFNGRRYVKRREWWKPQPIN